jgi:hypothetical protein
MSFLDNLPAPLRHLAFSVAAIVAGVLLQSFQANYTSWNLSAPLVAVISACLPLLIAYVTPLTAQYGLGSGGLGAPAMLDEFPQDSAVSITPAAPAPASDLAAVVTIDPAAAQDFLPVDPSL